MAFASPGSMNVDWEERWNVDRLRRYRFDRARAALEASDLGAILAFDFNNIRYLTSTHIGEWARDKMTRYALQTRGGQPHIWDFGSAARHHRLNCPWLLEENVHAGMIGLRGAVAPDAGLFRDAARQIAAILKAEGVADMPLGVDIVEPPMQAALEAEGIVVRDGQQVMLDAREVKSIDEIILLNTACAMVDGAYQYLAEHLKPGVRESELVADVTKVLFDLGAPALREGAKTPPAPPVVKLKMIPPTLKIIVYQCKSNLPILGIWCECQSGSVFQANGYWHTNAGFNGECSGAMGFCGILERQCNCTGSNTNRLRHLFFRWHPLQRCNHLLYLIYIQLYHFK